jgi:rRNA maturation endonuclease Nob1
VARARKLAALFRGPAPRRTYRVLDTSVIIDGRVADICETGFMDGTLVVPQFVLKELQMVADSSDSMKRNRGRRGLDILQKIQKMAGLDVVISDRDFPEIREVDLKLIELARALGGKIVTNDFNLNKVAQLRGVEVLNINELANSLKPVVLPGEIMKVFILKEGKEYNQGVAYLDDGTMVVVDNRAQADWQDHRRRGHERAPDDGRQDDLRAFHRPRHGDAATRRASADTACGSCGRGQVAAGIAPCGSLLSLVADGVPAHSRHRCVHHRSGDDVAGLESVRRARLLSHTGVRARGRV